MYRNGYPYDMGTIERERDGPGVDARDRQPTAGSRFMAVVVAVVVVLLGVVALIVLGVLSAAGVVLGGPREIDRSGPAVLQAVEDLSDYTAATGQFQVVVDIEQDDPILPSFLRGERTLFVANGSVDATVDFDGLGPEGVEVNEDRTAVTVSLPPPTLSDAVIDPEESYVFGRQRGLIDRIEGVFEDEPTSERALYLAAEDRLEAAAADSDLADTAERNTRAMLDQLMRSLGFTDVTVRFG